MEFDLHQQFQHYREGGTAFSVTLIGLAGSLIYWQYTTLVPPSPNSTIPRALLLAQIVILALVIILSLGIQLSTYLGYKHQANAFLYAPDHAQRHIHWSAAQIRLRWADRLVLSAAVTMCLTFVLLGVQFVMQFR